MVHFIVIMSVMEEHLCSRASIVLPLILTIQYFKASTQLVLGFFELKLLLLLFQ